MLVRYYQLEAESLLDGKAFEEGSIYFIQDTKRIYMDPVGGTTRKLITDSPILINTQAEFDEILTPIPGKVYVVIETNTMYVYNDGIWYPVEDNTKVSYTESQGLTEDQKVLARTNIGAGTSNLELDDNLKDSTKAAPADIVGQIELDTMMLSSSSTLTWDGDLTGREKFLIDGDTVSSFYMVHISDIILPKAPLNTTIEVLVTLKDIYGAYASEVISCTVDRDDGFININNAIINIPYDNIEIYSDGRFLVSKGIYFMAVVDNSSGLVIQSVGAVNFPGIIFKNTSWNDLNDKPFYDKYLLGDTVVNGNNISGSIDLSNRTSISAGIRDLILISTDTPTLDDLANGFSVNLEVTSNGESTEFVYTKTADEVAELIESGELSVISNKIALTNSIIIVLEDATYTDEGLYIKNKGIYMWSGDSTGTTMINNWSITINNYTFSDNKDVIKTIDYRYLPDALQIGKTVYDSDTLTWDGDITGLEVLPDTSNMFFKLSDSAPTLDQIMNGFTIEFVSGNKVIVSADEAKYAIENPDADGSSDIICIEVIDGNTSLILLLGGACFILTGDMYDSGSLYAKKGTYLCNYYNIYTNFLSINGFNGFETFEKINYKYLPNKLLERLLPELIAPELQEGNCLQVIDGVWGDGRINGLPDVSSTDNGKSLQVVNGEWAVNKVSGLPDVSSTDNGKSLQVVNGTWTTKKISHTDLDTSSASEGAFLRIVDGVWTAVVLPNAEDGEF